MSTVTLQSLYNSIESMKKSINSLSGRVSDLENISGIYITESTLSTSIRQVNDTISDLNKVIGGIESKLQKITLPEDTKYYLEQSEISNFRKNFRQLRVMMTEVENSRQAMIKLLARYNLTNSIS